MKKQISILSFSILLVAAVALTASTQQGKSNKENKEQQQNKGRGHDKKENGDKANKGNSGHQNDDGQQGKINGNGNNGNKGKNEMHNKGNDDMHANRGRDNNMNHGNMGNDDYGYNWNRQNFKDRKKIKNQDKVTICHKFNRGGEDAVTINVSANAARAHMNHGDVMGSCAAVTGNRRFSDIFYRNRTSYYNNLQSSQEQVYYSRSILDYALLRLANSRLQLNSMQLNNMPLADIQRKQGTVVELEQNVSLLQTVLGLAANLVASKFQ